MDPGEELNGNQTLGCGGNVTLGLDIYSIFSDALIQNDLHMCRFYTTEQLRISSLAEGPHSCNLVVPGLELLINSRTS